MVPERGDEPGSDGDGGANGDAQVTDPVTPSWGTTSGTTLAHPSRAELTFGSDTYFCYCIELKSVCRSSQLSSPCVRIWSLAHVTEQRGLTAQGSIRQVFICQAHRKM